MTVHTEIVPLNAPRGLTALAPKAPTVFLPDAKAAERFFDFFTSTIRNKHTRRAYDKAAGRFSAWCEGRGLLDLGHVKPLHVASSIEWLALPEPKGQGLAKPSVMRKSVPRSSPVVRHSLFTAR